MPKSDEQIVPREAGLRAGFEWVVHGPAPVSLVVRRD
jgi:hypothetical protein